MNYTEIQENKPTLLKTMNNYIPLIVQNIFKILPEVNENTFDTYTAKEIIEWIYLSNDAIVKISNRYTKKCMILKENTIHLYNCYQKNKNNKLDMEKLEKLPDDILRHIYEFTGPDIRLKFFEGKYPDVSNLLKPLTVPILKKIHKCLYYCHYICSRTQPRKKEKMIELINKYVKSYKNPRIQNNVFYEQKCIDLYLNILVANKIFSKKSKNKLNDNKNI